MSMLQKANDQGGRFETKREAIACLTAISAAQTVKTIGDDFFQAVDLVAEIQALKFDRLLGDLNCAILPNAQLLTHLRLQLCLHCIRTMGRQSYMLLSADKLLATQECYFSTFQLDVLDRLCTAFDVATVPLGSQPSIFIEYGSWTGKNFSAIMDDLVLVIHALQEHLNAHDTVAYDAKKEGMKATIVPMKTKCQMEAFMGNELGTQSLHRHTSPPHPNQPTRKSTYLPTTAS